MPNTNNQIVAIASPNLALNTALMGMEDHLRRAAQANVDAAGEGFTDMERHAMLVTEELKLVNGMDLAALYLRYKLIKQIINEALHTIHPNHDEYPTYNALANSCGICPSELSNIIDLCETIFPYLENRLGLSIPVLWEEIGKSSFRELTAVLKAIIGGDAAVTSENVRAAAHQAMDSVAATAAVAGQEMDDDQIRETAVRNLLEVGQLPVREIRTHLRPDRTPSVQATIVNASGAKYFMAEVSDDQLTMINRLLTGHMDVTPIELPQDRRMRQLEATRAPVLGRLIRIVEE